MAVEEFGRTHSITGGRSEEEAAEQRYAAVREPLWRRATSTDPVRAKQMGEEYLVRTRPGYGATGVGNLLQGPPWRHRGSPAFRRLERLWEAQALVFGEEFPYRLAGGSDPVATVSADPDVELAGDGGGALLPPPDAAYVYEVEGGTA